MLRYLRMKQDQIWAVTTLVPSMALVTIFVYVFIGWTGYVSLTRWNSFTPNYRFWGIQNYLLLFKDYRFQSDLRNLLFFTICFIAICAVIGLLLAVLLDQKVKGEIVFRNIFLFPMALSFIVTGVAWRWLLNPNTGFNLLLKAFGMHHVPKWYISTDIIPRIHWGLIDFGIPVALLSVVFAAVWQMSGFAMAIYLATLRSISEEIKEAAYVDGAGPWKTFWYVIMPQLRTGTVTITIILVQVSLKTFDLVYSMTGPGTAFVTDLPSLDMFTTTFQAFQYARGSAIAIIMFLLMLNIVIPYLWINSRIEGKN